jgi:C4-dicarboxylate transporter DctQ subunit
MSRFLLDSLEYLLEVINRIITRISKVIIVILMSSMVLILGTQVFSRYVLNSSIFWNEEFSRYCVIWIVFLGIAIAFKEEQHANITNLVDIFPPKISLLILLMSQSVLIFFLFYLIKYGFILAMNNLARGHISPAMQIPIWWAYFAIPVGAVSMLLQVLQKIIRVCKNLLYT